MLRRVGVALGLIGGGLYCANRYFGNGRRHISKAHTIPSEDPAVSALRMREFAQYDFSVPLAYLENMWGDTSGWKKMKDFNGVKCYSRVFENSPFVAYRGVGVFDREDVEMDEIMDVVMTCETEERRRWDPLLSEMRVVSSVVPGKKDVVYCRYDSPARYLGIRDRDILVARLVKKDPSTGNIYCAAVAGIEPTKEDDDDDSSGGDAIRMGLLAIGCVVGPDPENPETKIRAEYVSCVDLGGWIPAWVTNITSAAQPESVAHVRRVMKEDRENESK